MKHSIKHITKKRKKTGALYRALYISSTLALVSICYLVQKAHSQDHAHSRAPIITSFSSNSSNTVHPQAQIPNQVEQQQVPYNVSNYNVSPAAYGGISPQPHPLATTAVQLPQGQSPVTYGSPVYGPRRIYRAPRATPVYPVQGAVSASQAVTGLRRLGPVSNPAGTLATSFARPNISSAPQPQIVPPGITGPPIHGPISPAPAGRAGTPGILTR